MLRARRSLINAQAPLWRLIQIPRFLTGGVPPTLRRLFGKAGGDARHPQRDYERLLVAALRQPELARYLRDERIAPIEPLLTHTGERRHP